MGRVDRAEIFRALCARQRIRREAGIRPLDMKSEYDHAVAVAEAARLRAMRAPIESQVRAEILAQMRAKHGASWPSDSGGRWLLMGMMRKTLFERYGL
jgi:hypothetical protein